MDPYPFTARGEGFDVAFTKLLWALVIIIIIIIIIGTENTQHNKNSTLGINPGTQFPGWV